MRAGRITGFRLRGKDVYRDRTCLLVTAPPFSVLADQHLDNPAEITQEHELVVTRGLTVLIYTCWELRHEWE